MDFSKLCSCYLNTYKYNANMGTYTYILICGPKSFVMVDSTGEDVNIGIYLIALKALILYCLVYITLFEPCLFTWLFQYSVFVSV